MYFFDGHRPCPNESGCGDGSGPAPNGEACEVADDCEGTVCLLGLGEDIEFPDGVCSVECDIDTGDGCTEEEICLIYLPTEQSNCYQGCEVDDECRDDYYCTAIGHSRACLPLF